jgi:hypothetical protein
LLALCAPTRGPSLSPSPFVLMHVHMCTCLRMRMCSGPPADARGGQLPAGPARTLRHLHYALGPAARKSSHRGRLRFSALHNTIGFFCSSTAVGGGNGIEENLSHRIRRIHSHNLEQEPGPEAFSLTISAVPLFIFLVAPIILVGSEPTISRSQSALPAACLLALTHSLAFRFARICDPLPIRPCCSTAPSSRTSQHSRQARWVCRPRSSTRLPRQWLPTSMMIMTMRMMRNTRNDRV